MMNNTVVLSDATALLQTQQPDSVPLIIADPSYGIGYHSNYYKKGNPHAPIVNDDQYFKITDFIQECKRVLLVGGALYLFSRWDIYPLWLPSIINIGLKLKTKIVWVKNNWTAGDLKGSFGSQYEEILFIVKGRHILRGRRHPNVWNFDRIPATRMLHPTQKPVPLLERAIESSSDKGDLVIDPFAGSGSTGEAAKRTGRNFLLGDIDPKMVSIARKRLGLLPVESSKDDTPLTEYEVTLPTPDQWGIHPEELRFIYEELQGNVRQL